jgi:hypothetical protein
MPVFGKKLKDISDSMDKLRDRMILQHLSPPITREQIYEALVRPEHMSALREADKVCGVIQRHTSAQANIKITGGKMVTVAFIFSEQLERLLPAYAHIGFHEDASRELREAVTAWAERRLSISENFTVAKAALRQLNNHMSSLSQMRIYFPGILALINMTGDPVMQQRAAKVADAPVPASLPSIDPELRQALMDATKLIARAMLLPTEAPAQREVSLRMSIFGHSVELPWKPGSKMVLD